MAYGAAGVSGGALEAVGFGKKPVPEAMTMKEIESFRHTYAGEDQAVFNFCYLTGARVSEALACRKQDIQVRKSRDLGDYLTVRLVTLKNKKVPFRDIPVPIRESEELMANQIFGYMIAYKIRDGDRIFNLTRTNAYNRLAKRIMKVRAIDKRKKEIIQDYEKPMNPHYLRHCRLTHLVQHYGFDELRLMRFAGWSNTNPATVYVHLNWMDLAKVMSQANNVGAFSW